MVHLQDATSLGAIAAQMKQTGKGIVTLVVPRGSGEEVEIKLPSPHQVTVALKNAINSLPGVAQVGRFGLSSPAHMAQMRAPIHPMDAA